MDNELTERYQSSLRLLHDIFVKDAMRNIRSTSADMKHEADEHPEEAAGLKVYYGCDKLTDDELLMIIEQTVTHLNDFMNGNLNMLGD